ncbi:hypothetical protein [Methanosarcina sp. MTP4]|uniref:EMC6-like membrane protein n=1 Tax=Methanosarcina sp. MTP4 TaxID=1434100 RepID=UPI000696F2F1|nr:hypothetical protein [Methanosarcina sp. MTP4]
MSKKTQRSKGSKSTETKPTELMEIPTEGAAESAEIPEKKSFIKEMSPEEKQKAHRDGIIKTIVAALLGIVAGFIVFYQYGAGEDRIWYALLTIVFVLTYYLQRLIYPQLQIDTKAFKFKDWFYVEFIVLDFFLVTWTLLLN